MARQKCDGFRQHDAIRHNVQHNLAQKSTIFGKQHCLILSILSERSLQNSTITTHANSASKRKGHEATTTRLRLRGCALMRSAVLDTCRATLNMYIDEIVDQFRRPWCTYYRKRGSASYIVREWLLWVVERERRLWRHRYHAEIASDHAYDYLDSALTLCICIRVDAFWACTCCRVLEVHDKPKPQTATLATAQWLK